MNPHLWTLLVTLALCGAAALKPQPEVRAPAGTFRGRILTSHSGADYASYRGIPFALPPTGDRRFALPEPHPVIEGTHDSTEYNSVCLQHLRGLKLGREDCLYLNVYTPLDAQTTTNPALKKVLVFIHGGALVVGSSNLYVPGDLVTNGDLIVVTFNYRLGWVGFLRGNSSLLPGNVGFWDQLLALKWVKDNIRYFLGDSSDVTLSGESAGSFSSSILSMSSVAKGLFNKVILLSGAAPMYKEPPRTTNDLLQIAANKFGCIVDSLPGHEDDVVACLKQVPAEDFLKDFDFGILIAGMSSGDDIIPRPLSRALNDSSFLREVEFFDRDYLVSITADEGYILVNSVLGKVDTTSLDSSVRDISWLVDLPETVIKRIVLEYKKLFGNLDKSVTAVLTDSFFLNGSLNFLDAYSKRQGQDDYLPAARAYLMSFDHILKYVHNKYVIHAFDLCYMFDLSPRDMMSHYYFMDSEVEFQDDDLKMKALYIDLVVDFVKTGKPGERLTRKTGVAWSLYDTDRKSYLSLSLKPSVGEDLLGDRRDIWEKLVPQWLSEERVEGSRGEL